jgi:hypothetical protein
MVVLSASWVNPGALCTATAWFAKSPRTTVTLNPSDQTVTAGHKVTFKAAATGNPKPTVRWQVSMAGGLIICWQSGDGKAGLRVT